MDAEIAALETKLLTPAHQARHDAKPVDRKDTLAMSEIFNIYCDESCHLENDHFRFMVLGGLWCPVQKSRKLRFVFVKSNTNIKYRTAVN